MYSKEILAKYIETALNADVANHVVSELMDEMDQYAVKLEEDLNPDDIQKFVKDDEIFTDNPDYRRGNDFNIYDNRGKLLLTITPDRTVEGKGALQFTVPCDKDDEETKAAFLDFCDRLQRNSGVVYPYSEE